MANACIYLHSGRAGAVPIVNSNENLQLLH